MVHGCLSIVIMFFWVVAALFGVGAFLFFIMNWPLWACIVTPIAFIVMTYFGMGD